MKSSGPSRTAALLRSHLLRIRATNLIWSLAALLSGDLLLSQTVIAQTASPEFDVVSVKHLGNFLTAARGTIPISRFRRSGDRFNCVLSLANIVRWAYRVDNQPWLFVGPQWTNEEVYEIAAVMPPHASEDDAYLMVQAMLADRFRLRFHREKRLFAVHVLVAVEGGPKLEEVPKPNKWTLAAKPGRSPDTVILEGQGPILPIVALLNQVTRRPVLDETGLSGFYKLKLEWKRDPGESGGMYEGMIAALPQIGLKLDSKKAMLEVLVVDHAEKEPTAN
jgi:uncharacterized protein (TIGR03435 family)